MAGVQLGVGEREEVRVGLPTVARAAPMDVGASCAAPDDVFSTGIGSIPASSRASHGCTPDVRFTR